MIVKPTIGEHGRIPESPQNPGPNEPRQTVATL